MTPTTIDTPNQTDMIRTFKTPLTIIRAHSEHLLAAYERLSPPQRVALLEAIQSQTILLEHLLDGLTNLPQTDQE